MTHNHVEAVYVDVCRGGLILYRTHVTAAALQNGAELDISSPVHDYARVTAPSSCPAPPCPAEPSPCHVLMMLQWLPAVHCSHTRTHARHTCRSSMSILGAMLVHHVAFTSRVQECCHKHSQSWSSKAVHEPNVLNRGVGGGGIGGWVDSVVNSDTTY